MKKISKSMLSFLLSLFLVIGGGYFTSCSSGSDDDEGPAQTVKPENPSPSNPDTPSNPDEKVEEDSGDLGNSLVYDFDTLTSVPTTQVGDNSILDGNVVYWVAEGKTGNAKVTANTDETHHYLQVSAGGDIATDLTKVDLSKQTTYLKLKAAQVGEEEIIFTFTTVKGGSDSDNRILIVDPSTSDILGQTKTIPCGTADDNTEKTLSVKATVPETFYVVFARSNGKGGFKFSKIEQKYGTAKAAQEAPVESDFTVADPTSAGAKGTITYNGEKIANLQYKDGETWYKWGTEAAKEFAAGKVTVRYGSTETEKVSETLELTINEYVNAGLETASAPAAGSVTSTATTSAENNDGTLVVDTEKEARALEYKLGDGNWTSFVENKATGLAGGTYTIRVKASETYNASTETISVIVKKFTAAPANADFTVTLASSDTAADATITAKSADVAANLMIVGAGAEGADASWSEIAGSETPLTVTVKAGTYKAYYAETETSVKSAESEIVVGVEVLFSKFLASEVYGDSAKDVELAKDTEAADKTWKILEGTTKVKKASVTTYDDKTYTARFSLENPDKGIKLYIGKGKTVNLRIDAGNSKSSIADEEDGTLKVGDQTWAVKYAGSTKYFTVTADANGYVSIVAGTKKSNIYAIEVVDSLVDTSTETRTATVTVLSTPKIILEGTKGSGEYENDYVINSELKANVAEPTYTVITYTAKADGIETVTQTPSEPFTIENPTWTYVWKKGDTAIADATTNSYTPTEAGSYSVVAKYSATIDEIVKTSSEATETASVVNPAAVKYTVTFNAGDGTFAEDAVTKVKVDANGKIESASIPKPTAPDGKRFKEWTSNEGLKTDSEITSDVTFTATYEDKPAVVCVDLGTYTFSKSDLPASGSTYPVTKAPGLTITGAKSIDSNGLNLTKNDKEYGLVFSVNKTVTVTLSSKEKKNFGAAGLIKTEDGTIAAGNGGTTVKVSDDKLSATIDAGTTPSSGSLTAVMTLTAGTYELLGNTTSSFKVVSIKLEE